MSPNLRVLLAPEESEDSIVVSRRKVGELLRCGFAKVWYLFSRNF